MPHTFPADPQGQMWVATHADGRHVLYASSIQDMKSMLSGILTGHTTEWEEETRFTSILMECTSSNQNGKQTTETWRETGWRAWRER